MSRFDKILNYSIVALIMLQNDSPFFLEPIVNRVMWLSILIVLCILVIYRKKPLYNARIITLLTTAWVLILIQYILYGGEYTPALLYKPIMLFYTTYLVFSLLADDYFKYLFNLIYWIAIYTSIIYLSHSLIPGLESSLYSLFDYAFEYSWADWPRTILIYSIPQESGYFLMRNSGLFHEAGAYGIYLVFGIIINTKYSGNPFEKKSIFLSAVTLSTFSTVAYIMLFMFYSYHVLKTRINIFSKILIILLLVSPMITVFDEAQFLREKIIVRYEKQVNAVKDEQINIRGRFYSLAMSIKSFSQNPLFGRGIVSVNRFDVGEMGSFGYGIGGLFARYGILFSFAYIFYYIRGLKIMHANLDYGVLYIVTIFLVLNIGLLTQIFFFHTPFIYPLFIGIYYRERIG